MSLKPLKSRVLLKKLPKKERVIGSFVLPQAEGFYTIDTPCEVIAIGCDVTHVEVGQIVYTEKRVQDVSHDGSDYIVAKEEDIIAIVT